MTYEAAMALALTCQTLQPTLAPIMVAIAQNENPSLDEHAIHINKNGTRDLGLAQVNEINLGWTKLKDPFDPCQNLTAAAKVLFAKYNGNPPDSLKAVYAAGVMLRLNKQAGLAIAAKAKADAEAQTEAGEQTDDNVPGLEDTPGQQD